MADLSTRLSTRFSTEEPPTDLEPESPESEERKSDRYHPFRRPLPRPGMFRLRGIRRSESSSSKRELPQEPSPERAPPARGRTLRLLLGFTLGATAAIAGLAAFHTVTRQGATTPHEVVDKVAEAVHDMAAVVPPPPTAPKPPTDSEIAASSNGKPTTSDVDAGDKPASAPNPASPAAAPPSASPTLASPMPSSPLQGAAAADQTSPAANAPHPAAGAAPANQQPLAPYEVMEVQTRLQWLGFSPGGLDGIDGHLTSAAVKRYEASKGLPQTGKADRSLLSRLRQDSLKPAKP